MALTEFQRFICHLIARQRLASGDRYVAGGLALNTATRRASVAPGRNSVFGTSRVWPFAMLQLQGMMPQHGVPIEDSPHPLKGSLDGEPVIGLPAPPTSVNDK
jgi:hypothetical protein